jgi:hypothetical protein
MSASTLFAVVEKIPIPNPNPNPIPNPNPNPVIQQIHKEIAESYSLIKRMNEPRCKVREINHPKQIPMPKTGLFSFPPEIKTRITDFSKSEITYSFSLFQSKRKINITFVVEEPVFSLHIYNHYLDKMTMWFSILQKYASPRCSNKIHVYLYLTPMEKRLPRTNMEMMGQIHVNTAYTSGCLPTTEIVIFRKEEWFKVFLHETFHCFGLDFADMNTSLSKQQILSLFPVSSQVNFYEAYTEFWATIVNSCFFAFFVVVNKGGGGGGEGNKYKFHQIFEKIMEEERKYSLFQMVKVLEFMGLQYQDLYSSSENSIIARKTLYKERTNVLSYYILKTILLFYYPEFLSFNNPKNIFQFEKTQENQLRFVEFIKKKYKNRDFLKGVSVAEVALLYFQKKAKNKNRSKDNNTDNYIITNMRMTLFG